jgi:hypothetical protein
MHQNYVGAVLFRQIQLKYKQVKSTMVQFIQRGFTVGHLYYCDVLCLNQLAKGMPNHAMLMRD